MWGKVARVGIFLAKAIIGVELSNPGAGAGASKASAVDGLMEVFLQEVAGSDVPILADPETKAAYESARDAIVHLHNVLSKKVPAAGV
jgi:hypothetical protein